MYGSVTFYFIAQRSCSEIRIFSMLLLYIDEKISRITLRENEEIQETL
jgi:hypothetical protein